jgi:hypothetical protein
LRWWHQFPLFADVRLACPLEGLKYDLTEILKI